MDADEVAAAFGLGEPMGPMVAAARGWGGHNVICRLHSTAGVWAIKVVGRELDELMTEHFEIEVAAFNGGIPMPRPIPALSSGSCAQVGGQLVRCHEWIDGAAMTNEETTVAEAHRMGEIMARLHGLHLPWSPRFDSQSVIEELTWAELAQAGSRRGARWAHIVTANLAALEAISAAAAGWRIQDRSGLLVGSHRDLNAHNVLFGPAGLSLVDWDAAGPIYPAWELANYATLWSARPDGSYDPEAILSFLAGYLEGGGHISGEEPDTLIALVDNVESWTKKNVRWALSSPTETQDSNAEVLIGALLTTPATVDQRRHLLKKTITLLPTAP